MTVSIILYRADKRDFKMGDVIQSAKEFMDKNREGSLDVEAAFESARPKHMLKRSDCLYLFENLKDAKKYWSKMRGGKLYEVAVEGTVHRVDMALVDAAFINRTNATVLREYAENYWSGAISPAPVIEILVAQARIVSIISKDEDERLAYFKSWAIGG